jgi:hypothetical protein
MVILFLRRRDMTGTKNLFRIVFLFLALIGMAGCLTTEYQARDFFGEGYSEARIGERSYKVDFQCSQETPESLCEGYLFRRCAELTRNTGFDYFVMETHSTVMKEKDMVVPGHYNTMTSGSGRDKTTAYVFQPGYTVKERYPVSNATISMHKGAKAADTRNAYTPEDILRYVTESQ